ncbi:hypothetical protein, partial [Staphylococcus aureus]
ATLGFLNTRRVHNPILRLHSSQPLSEKIFLLLLLDLYFLIDNDYNLPQMLKNTRGEYFFD